MKAQGVGLLAVVMLMTSERAWSRPPVQPPIAHPAVMTASAGTPAVWRSGVGRFGEHLVETDLKARGYTVSGLKLPANQGIDLVAVKRSANGHVTDVKLVEVKAHYGHGPARLSNTRLGPQLSRSWLADRFKRLRATGREGRELAHLVYSFRKESGVPIERLGELHDINLRTGWYDVRDPVTQVSREGRSVKAVLTELSNRSTDRVAARSFAHHAAEYERMHTTRMSDWVTANRSPSRAGVALRATGRGVLKASTVSARLFTRAAGPLALIATTGLDGYEAYELTAQYRRGDLTRREYTSQVTRLVGGWAGATAFAAGGVYLGVSAGASIGGPFAWATGPIGGLIGGGIGGLVGYFSGTYVTEQIVVSWYDSLDEKVAAGLTDWFVRGPCPTGQAQK